MEPRDITGRVLARPIHSPYGAAPRRSRMRLWLILGGAWLLWVAVISDHSLWRIVRLKRDLGAANAEIARVHARTQKLDDQLHDPHARAEHGEEVLRKQGMARPGEIVYRLGEGRDSTSH